MQIEFSEPFMSIDQDVVANMCANGGKDSTELANEFPLDTFKPQTKSPYIRTIHFLRLIPDQSLLFPSDGDAMRISSWEFQQILDLIEVERKLGTVIFTKNQVQAAHILEALDLPY